MYGSSTQNSQILARIKWLFYAAVTHLKLSQVLLHAHPRRVGLRDHWLPKEVEGLGGCPPNVAAALERLGAAIAADSARRRHFWTTHLIIASNQKLEGSTREKTYLAVWPGSGRWYRCFWRLVRNNPAGFCMP